MRSMAASTYESSRKHVGELLGTITREKIVVPQFQRGYEWEEKQVRALWKDLIAFQKQRKESEKYFFGPIVIRYQDGKIILLDGQQRLATITILLSVLRDVARPIPGKDSEDFWRETQRNFIAKNKDGFALTLGETDARFFEAAVQSDTPCAMEPEIRTHFNILAAKSIFAGLVREHIGSASADAKLILLGALRQTIQSDLVMAAIQVESEKDAYRIFETLNDRGLSLAAPDLLLNHLMWKASDDEARKLVKQSWNNIINTLESAKFEEFLRAMWVSMYGDIKVGTFEGVSAYLEEHLDVVAFAKLCETECYPYVEIVTEENSLKGAEVHVHNLLKDLRAEAAIPLLLSCKRRFSDAKSFKKICQWLLVFVTRYSVLSHNDRSGLEDILFKLASEVHDCKVRPGAASSDKERAEYIKTQLVAHAPTDVQIKALEGRIELNQQQARYVLIKLANALQTPNDELAVRRVTLEHIFPKNPNPNEWGGKGNHARLIPHLWNWGNLTYLGNKTNAEKCKNEDYPVKRKVYKEDTNVLMTQRIADHYKKWGVDEILSRSKHLAEEALRLWSFNALSKI